MTVFASLVPAAKSAKPWGGSEPLLGTNPLAIAIPYGQDRHPDHGGASRVLTTAAFLSGLRRYEPDTEPWRPV